MFHAANFINGFVKYYMENATEYDLSLAFDEYIDDVVEKNSNDDNQFIINTYEQIKINVGIELNMKVRVSCILYDTFYRDVEEALDAAYRDEAYNGDTEPTVVHSDEELDVDDVPIGGFAEFECDIEPTGPVATRVH